jgi:phosphatidylglycerophosphate synthase
VSAAADALGLLRLGAAALLPATLARALEAPGGSWTPLALVTFAAGTDFVDGRLARRAGPTRHGAILDVAADVTFVLAATGGGASQGLVPWAAPLAIALAAGAYALASMRLSTGRQGFGLARSRVGHAAGVVNYGLAVLVAASVALPDGGWTTLLRAASVVVVAVNLAAVAERFVPRPSPGLRATSSARASHAGESRDR